MKKQLLFLACTLIISMQAAAQDTIRFTWNADTSEKSIVITATAGTDNISVNWGDGNIQSYNGGDSIRLSHTYSSASSYNVIIVTTDSNTTLTYLDCSSNPLTSLDVSANTALTELVCYNNKLTSLDVSTNTVLTYLHCSTNQLTSLDLSTNTALTSLHCSSNPLTSLDVSANTAMTELECSNNQLTSFDISTNTALTKLWCYYNLLTSLDISANTALTELYCGRNQLTSLDVSGAKTLTTLYCSYNPLTSLDVSGATTLTYLDCVNSQLTSLDVSGATALTYLDCYNNQLTSIDVSGATALTELGCNNNQLTSLDVSANTALTDLWCNNNQLTSLDVSANKALTSLICVNNQLTSIDVSGATALTELGCNNNQLTSLDLSANTVLTYLDCSSNPLTSLDVSGATALTGLSCSSNQLTSLDLSANTELTYLSCQYNVLSLSDLYAASESISDVTNKYLGAQTHASRTVVKANPINLSGEMNLGGTQTSFSVSKGGAAAMEDTDYSLDYSAETISFLGLGNYRVIMTNSEITSNSRHPAQVIMKFEVREARTDASLLSLEVSEGKLSPEFDAEEYSYTVNVDYSTTKITITAVSIDESATISGNGTYNLAVGSNPFVITVTAEDGTTEKEYTVTVIRAEANTDATLASLTVSEGILEPEFSSDIFDYVVYLHTVKSNNINMTFTIIAAATDPNAKVIGDGDHILQSGENHFDIVVTAEDGETTQTYTVNVMFFSGIDEIKNDNISVYPNPVTNILHIKTKDEIIPEIKLFSTEGKLLLQTKSNQIDMSGFVNGLYFLKVGDVTNKIVKY